ncbi:MAG: transporter substrate-binding protein [Klenkia sp.]|nr:transporter substrate-binding protein [Klenkia sp.]
MSQRSGARRALIAAVAGVTVVALAACGSGGGSESGSSSAEGPVVWVDGGGAYHDAMQEGVLDPFTADTGIDVTVEAGTDNAKLRSMVDANRVVWDVYNGDNTWGTSVDGDYLEPLDYSVIDQDQILEGYSSEYRVANSIYSIVLAYNTDQVTSEPSGWADFFDLDKYPGKRGVMDYSLGGLFEIALLADGVAPENLYPLDIDRAIAKLDTIKDSLVFWQSGSESEEIVGSGEVAMVMTYNARAYDARENLGLPVDYTFNQQILAASYLSVPRGTQNLDAAMQLIAYAVSAEHNGAPSQFSPLAPSNTEATPDAAMEQDLPTAHLDQPHASFDDEYIAQNSAEIDSAYQAWRASS